MATRSTPKTVFTCRECGGTTPEWLGECPHCEAWSTREQGIAEAPSGGGIVEGGMVLIGGDPGIGKSTLLLQALDSASQGLPVTVAVVE